MCLQQLDKVERGCDAYAQGILELLVCALVNAFHQRQSIVYYAVHLVVLCKDFGSECLKHLFLGNVAHIVAVALLFVYNIDGGTTCAELTGNAFANAVCTACYNNYLLLECMLHDVIIYVSVFANVI